MSNAARLSAGSSELWLAAWRSDRRSVPCWRHQSLGKGFSLLSAQPESLFFSSCFPEAASSPQQLSQWPARYAISYRATRSCLGLSEHAAHTPTSSSIRCSTPVSSPGSDYIWNANIIWVRPELAWHCLATAFQVFYSGRSLALPLIAGAAHGSSPQAF